AIAANWRLIPNLAGQVNIADVSLPIAGAKLNVASAVKPALDGMVREQISALEARLRNDPFIENAARSQWTKLCRAIPLSCGGQTGAQAGAPASASTEAQTRIVASETKPACPFPNQLDLVGQGNEGRVTIAVPIDIPFGEVSRLLQAQFAGKTFPED